MQQQAVECNFAENDSWIILSAIEQSIKRKIEAVGTPLKDWDIRINYGIKTGFNEAFVITTDKRNEILANCQTEGERTRTAELIRPILRGRDIKRYAYNWAGLYLIATFPSRHYDIEMYPAVKQYLLTFGIEKLEQTGKTYIVNGEKLRLVKRLITSGLKFKIVSAIGTNMRSLFLNLTQKVRYTFGTIQYRSQGKYITSLAQPEVKPLIDFGIHLKRCVCFLSK